MALICHSCFCDSVGDMTLKYIFRISFDSVVFNKLCVLIYSLRLNGTTVSNFLISPTYCMW